MGDKYILLTKRLREILPLITIDESAKEDFKETMGLTEKQFNNYTLKLT